jgi:PKD repeat protein
MPTQKLSSTLGTTFLIVLVVLTTIVHAAEVNLSWTAPTTNANGTPLKDLAGYKVYYGLASRSYSSDVDVGNRTTYTVSGLAGGKRYYFAVTAYDTSGNESAFSVERSLTTPTATLPPPVANFTAAPTAGPAPLSVKFTDTSTGDISSWSWTFGDNGTSTARHPSHTYAAAGSYTVRLTVTGPGGSNVATKTGYIDVGATSSGLVAAYGFDEGSGNTVMDASGRGHHGTISGATWGSSGRYGRALSFDGVNDWVTINDAASLDLTTGMTLEAWVYPTATLSGWRTVIQKEQSGGSVYYLQANSDTNQPATGVFVNGEQILRGGARLAANTWTHLAATYDGARQRLYVNGVEVANRAQSGAIQASSGRLRIGGNSVWGEYFQGRIDEVRVYNRPLQVSEIKADMNTSVAAAAAAMQSLRGVPVATLRDKLRGNNLHALSSPSASEAEPRAKRRVHQPREGSSNSAASVKGDAIPWHSGLLECGEMLVDQSWKRVGLQKAFADPVVIASPLSSNAGEQVIVRVRNVDPTGFEIRLQGWSDQEGAHPPETVGYLVMERGTYTLGNQTLVEAGSFETDGTNSSGSMTFSRRFNVVPVAVTTVTSTNEPEAVTSELRAVTRSGAKFRLHKPDPSQPANTPETISFIAWEPSSGTMDGLTFEVNRTRQIAPGQLHAIAFTETFAEPPVLLAAIQTVRSGHSAILRWLNKGTDQTEVIIEEPRLGGKAAQSTSAVSYIILR